MRSVASFHAELERITEHAEPLHLALHALGGALGTADVTAMARAFDAVHEAALLAQFIAPIAAKAEQRITAYREG